MQDACYMKMRSAPFAGRVLKGTISRDLRTLNISPEPFHNAEDTAENSVVSLTELQ
jgi:hypothetical protein